MRREKEKNDETKKRKYGSISSGSVRKLYQGTNTPESWQNHVHFTDKNIERSSTSSIEKIRQLDSKRKKNTIHLNTVKLRI